MMLYLALADGLSQRAAGWAGAPAVKGFGGFAAAHGGFEGAESAGVHADRRQGIGGICRFARVPDFISRGVRQCLRDPGLTARMLRTDVLATRAAKTVPDADPPRETAIRAANISRVHFGLARRTLNRRRRGH